MNDQIFFPLDTDGDGLFDYQERDIYFTRLDEPDTDADGLSDGDEVLTHTTDPFNPDTDFDSVSDGIEVLLQVDGCPDPLNPDSDADSLSDSRELFEFATDPCNPDVVIEVVIDIKPGSDPNCFNNDGHGVLPVAVLGNATFDVGTIVADSVRLEGLVIRAVGKSNRLLAHLEDVNGDGFDDLVVQIEDEDGVFSVGTTTATLFGRLNDDSVIWGTDELCIVR
jgi:hypothetical protein